jgi:hypothetical protein
MNYKTSMIQRNSKSFEQFPFRTDAKYFETIPVLILNGIGIIGHYMKQISCLNILQVKLKGHC